MYAVNRARPAFRFFGVGSVVSATYICRSQSVRRVFSSPVVLTSIMFTACALSVAEGAVRVNGAAFTAGAAFPLSTCSLNHCRKWSAHLDFTT